MARRAFDHRRNLLHVAKLNDFVSWALANGYRQHPTPPKAGYEVARLELIHPAGNFPHIVIYRRLTGEHLTLCQDGANLVHRWMRARRAA